MPLTPADSATLSLDSWIERQAGVCAAKLAGAVSATHLVCRRPGFGQTVRPVRGSVLASPATDFAGAPDYFFHWLRDGAAVMDAALALMQGPGAAAWIERFHDWVDFTLALGRLDGRTLLKAAAEFRRGAASDFQQYIRPDAEIAAVDADHALDDVRYGADGMLDFIKWSRPQHDGGALNAIAALRFWHGRDPAGEARKRVAELIAWSLDYTLARVRAPSYDIWEEENGEHFYTRLVQLVALERGARWLAAQDDGTRARRCAEAARALEPAVAAFWCPERRLYRSRAEPAGASPKACDMSVILGVLHAGRETGGFSVADERVAATMARLEEMFAADYALNRGRARPFAFGRYRGDRYFSGGAWYLCSFAAAEYYYRRAVATRAGTAPWAPAPEDSIARGDEILAALRRYIPPSGELSEQFDQTTGAQTSAKNLTWSYAAFITAAAARRAALCSA